MYISYREYWAALLVFPIKSKSRRERADESVDRIAIPINFDNVSRAMMAKKSAKKCTSYADRLVLPY